MKEEVVTVATQSPVATAGVFLVILLLLSFYQTIIGIRGFMKIVVSGGVAYLFYNYWSTVIDKIVTILAIFGLEAV